MHCDQCREQVSDYIDGLLELGEQTQIERHLANCEPCRAVRDDVLQIVHFSRQLPLQTPSSALWSRISSEVAVDRPAGFLSRLRRELALIKSRNFEMSLPQLIASAAAVVILVSLGVIMLRQPLATQEFSTASGVSSTGTTILSHQDFQQIEQRIDELSKTVQDRQSNWDPELKVAFQRNMIYVEQSLAECRHELSYNPSDNVAQELMLGAYREKVRLLEGFSKF
jgi:anti-sigma-K factor RskA